jgi:predicted transcriptional regulator
VYKFLEETVAGHMTNAVKTVTRELTVRDLSDMFERDDFNAYPVEEDAQVVGIVTKFDLLKCFVFTPNQMVPQYEQLMNRTVADVMTSEFIYVRTRHQIDAGTPARIASAAKCRSVRNRKTDNSSLTTTGIPKRLISLAKTANAVFRWPSCQPSHLNDVDFDQIAFGATVVVWIRVRKREFA